MYYACFNIALGVWTEIWCEFKSSINSHLRNCLKSGCNFRVKPVSSLVLRWYKEYTLLARKGIKALFALLIGPLLGGTLWIPFYTRTRVWKPLISSDAFLEVTPFPQPREFSKLTMWRGKGNIITIILAQGQPGKLQLGRGCVRVGVGRVGGWRKWG